MTAGGCLTLGGVVTATRVTLATPHQSGSQCLLIGYFFIQHLCKLLFHIADEFAFCARGFSPHVCGRSLPPRVRSLLSTLCSATCSCEAQLSTSTVCCTRHSVLLDALLRGQLDNFAIEGLIYRRQFFR